MEVKNKMSNITAKTASNVGSSFSVWNIVRAFQKGSLRLRVGFRKEMIFTAMLSGAGWRYRCPKRSYRASKSIIRRCQLLLELNENNPRHLTQMQIANSFGVCKATVSNIVKDYIEQGLDASITYKRNPNSNAKRKVDGRDEARIIELACSRPPEGRSRWTLRFLEEKSKLILDTPIGKDTIRNILKKRNLDLT